MNKMGSAAKVKLNSFDDLFGTEQPQAGTEQVQSRYRKLHYQNCMSSRDTHLRYWTMKKCRKLWRVSESMVC